jgi:di/tricarboxylate transporter
MFPVAVWAAARLGVQPMSFVIAIPIGYQANLMVQGPGSCRSRDLVRVGLPLSLVVGTAVLWAIRRLRSF